MSEELWVATRRRMELVARLYDCEPGRRPSRGRSAGSPYLFTGLLECASCRGSITIVSGQWKTRSDSRYGCSMHAYRGDRLCKNNLLVARSALEKQLLAGLREKVLHRDVIDYTFARFEDGLARSMNRQSGETAAARRQLQKIEAEIRNCTEAIASMGLSNSLRAKLVELEAQHGELTEKLAGIEPRAVRLHMRDTRQFVESRLRNLHSMLTGEPRLARAEIAKHVEKIILTPEGRVYIASGTWDVLGGVAVRMVPGPESNWLRLPFQDAVNCWRTQNQKVTCAVVGNRWACWAGLARFCSTLCSTLFLVLISSPFVAAQEKPDAPKPEHDRKVFIAGTALLAASKTADATTTRQLLDRGGY